MDNNICNNINQTAASVKIINELRLSWCLFTVSQVQLRPSARICATWVKQIPQNLSYLITTYIGLVALQPTEELLMKTYDTVRYTISNRAGWLVGK